MAKPKFDITSLLNQQSLPESDTNAGGFDVQMIPLSEITPNVENFYDVSDIEELAEDILQHGLMHNIVVQRRGEDDKYTIISGERRFRAFSLLAGEGKQGYESIPALVDEEENPLLVNLKLISANATARVLSDFEKAVQAEKIAEIVRQLKKQGVELPGRVREITAQALGVSVAQAGRLEKIARDLVPEVKEQFRAGNIGVTEAYETATLPPEQQAQAVEKRVEKKTAPLKTASAPEPAKEFPHKPPHIGTAVRLIQWAAGFDAELTEAAQCLEHWNETTPNMHGYGVCKGLIIREAAMRKKRAE